MMDHTLLVKGGGIFLVLSEQFQVQLYMYVPGEKLLPQLLDCTTYAGISLQRPLCPPDRPCWRQYFVRMLQ